MILEQATKRRNGISRVELFKSVDRKNPHRGVAIGQGLNQWRNAPVTRVHIDPRARDERVVSVQ